MSEETNQTAQTAEAAAEKSTKTIKVKAYRIAKLPDENVKCPPQAKVIVDTLKAMQENNGNQPVVIDDLVAKLKEDGKLNTRQSEARIFTFYRPKLMEQKVLEETVTEQEIPVEAKPKKEKVKAEVAAAEEVAADPNAESPSTNEGVKVEQVEGKKSKKEKAAPQTV